mmetsp:Transcript_43701/g.70275  ORF Transcript_43701/g.70275 Transcript_43701/m.70275 type:complete len:85 (+) Transcript_43701:162-416(+)
MQVRQLVAIAMHLVREKDLLSLRSIPTMIVVGGEDNLISPENSRYLAKTLRGNLVHFPRSGHSIQREKPEKLCELLMSHAVVCT